jgi:hypothetical protein
MPRGGKRPNSGPKKGSHRPHFYAQQVMLAQFRERVQVEFEPLLTALIESAKGASIVLQQTGAGWTQLTDPNAIVAAFNAGEALRIECKPPDQRAQKEVWERTLGKVQESVKVDADIHPVRVVYEFPSDVDGDAA